MSLKRNFCTICGNEINFDYGASKMAFRINEVGEIVRESDEDFDVPVLEFFCSEDKDHDLGSDDSLINWMDEIEQYFHDNECYNL